LTVVDSKVVALVADLMDRSKVSASVPGVMFARAVDGCDDADVVIVDLARHGDDIASIRALAPAARIVAFGSHVDDEAFARARDAGADVVLPRSRFFRDPAAAITSPPAP
jgi:DNA-binding NarL/FixJ family response regulator